jgi:hypothetical protein
VATEDEILRAYEAELGPEPPAGSNRGFWLVVGALFVAAAFLVVEILAHRPLADTIGHAQTTLRRAEAAAETIRSETGGFGEADASGLSQTLPNLRFLGAREPSVGLDDVSVAASDRVWAGAVQARPGACFYLRLEIGADPRYGSGEECTGEAALLAAEPRW